MRITVRLPSLSALLFLVSSLARAGSDVVLNEIMYNPPGDQDDLQYVELFNRGSTPVSLAGWSFKSGLEFAFPNDATLVPGGFLVLSKNPIAFRRHYGANPIPLGPFNGKLKHGGERIELVTASGATVDGVQFRDKSPWPMGPDGYGPSLERILADGPSSSPENWASSTMPPVRRAAGTPGKRNDSFAPTAPPTLFNFTATPPKPGQPVVVECDIMDGLAVTNVVIKTSAWVGAQPSTEQEIVMERVAGDAKKGRYRGKINAAPSGTLIRYKIVAAGQSGFVRSLPGENEPGPAFSYYVGPNTNNAFVPFVYISQATKEKRSPARPSRGFGGGDSPASASARATGYMLYAPTNGGPVQVFDNIRVVSRKGGWKVHFRKDQSLENMTTVNLIFEYHPRYVLAEHMAYELFRGAGLPAPQSGHMRVWMNGRPMGYHLLVEQPNRHFLKRTERDEDANLYKIIWYGEDLVSQHEKKTNLSSGHEDVKQIVAELDRTQGQAQWAVIEKNFNVSEFINYYAVNMCIQNWDGFFNNHDVYHERRPGGKWGIIPWDEDKTWGDHDGASSNYDWYEMPLTYAMRGDKPPGDLKSMFFRSPFGNSAWWRPPGWFSGPLLANPEFRRRFLVRLNELCNSVFTEKEMIPIINELEKRMEPEVRFRAASLGQNQNQALTDLKRHIESLRNQVINRRKFILAELAKTKAPH